MSRMIKRMSKRRSFLSNQILPSHLLLLQQSLHNPNPCHCPPGMTDTDDQRSLMILSLPRYRLSQQSQPSHQDAGMMQLDVPTSHQPVQGQALGQKLKNSYSKLRFRYYIRQSKYSLSQLHSWHQASFEYKIGCIFTGGCKIFAFYTLAPVFIGVCNKNEKPE